MTALYNEIDPFAAEWLRWLIATNQIAPGVVNTQSIEDLTPAYVSQFTQVHFFAGIGVWSYALRRSGWRDDQPIWSASCPCQPFSTAGKGDGFDDPRHLWPSLHWLIAQCKPAIIVGEQVSDVGAWPWIDLVQSDVEALDYAFGCLASPAASVGAPIIRHRVHWLASADSVGLERLGELEARFGAASVVNTGRQTVGRSGEAVGGLWAAPDWIACRDGRWRPVEPGSFPLADGAPRDVGRLRGYGNAINAEHAVTFLRAALS